MVRLEATPTVARVFNRAFHGEEGLADDLILQTRGFDIESKQAMLKNRSQVLGGYKPFESDPDVIG